MKNWKDISIYFTPQLQKIWESKGFTYLTTLKVEDAEYAYWLANILQLEPLIVLNEGYDVDLREQFAEWKKDNPNPISKQKPWPWKLMILVLILVLFTYCLLK